MNPVAPGWVALSRDEWFHVVGWTIDFQPVCANPEGGVFVWRTEFGADPYEILPIGEVEFT